MVKEYKKAKYRVILMSNGVYKKTLYRCMKKDTVFIRFNKIKNENKVTFPKRYINSRKIKPVRFDICVVKITDENDTNRLLRDGYGKLYIEETLPDWTILDSAPFEIEETFWVFGMEDEKYRPTIDEVISRLFTGAYAKKMVKQVIVVYNKLIIYNENQFDMVVCKNIFDAQRLHHTLSKLSKKQKIKSLLFMGTASKANRGRLYDLIVEKTNWDILKVRRTSTRP